MMRLFLAGLLVAYLPGALTFRLPFARREQRAALAADERAFWAVMLSIAWSLCVVVALAAVERYQFTRLLAVNAVLSTGIAIVCRRGLRYGGTAGALSWTDGVPLAIVCLGLWLYFPPSEYVTGGLDPGTYINEGIQIAQRGSLFIRDQTVEEVPAALRDLFFPSYNVPWYYSLRFMGFFIRDPNHGSVVGQFPHLYPAFVAIGYGLNGLSGARQAVGVSAILGLLAVYFAGSRLVGRLGGCIAAGLLAVNVIQVWFARYPNSELLTQSLLFAAVLAHGRGRDGGQLFFGAVAGALLGLQLFLRFDAVLAIAAFATASAMAPFVRERVGGSFLVMLVPIGAVGLWYLAGPMQAYSWGFFGYTRDHGGWVLAALALVALLTLRGTAQLERWAAFFRSAAPAVLAIAVVSLAAYAYFFRQPAGRLALGDAMAFRTFGWYVTPWGLAAAVAGLAVLIRRSFWRDPAFFLTLLTHALFFFYKTRIVPEHFWSGRRFLTAILPGAMICIGGLAVTLLNASTLGRFTQRLGANDAHGRPQWLPIAGAALAIAAVVPLAVAFLRASEPIRHHVEYAGMIPRLEQLAARIGERDLVIAESRNASEVHVLALPLAYVYARNVLVLANPTPDKRALEAFLAWARDRYEAVLFLGEGGTDLLTKRIDSKQIMSDRFEVPEYDSPLNAYPSGVRLKKFTVGLYRLEPGAARAASPIDLTIGADDDLHVLRFHAKEFRADADLAFRWTRDVSYVLLLWRDPAARRITIWMGNGGRPPAAPTPMVEVSLGEQVLGTAMPVDQLRPYSFDVSEDLANRSANLDDSVRLRLKVSTWKPSDVLGVVDDRELGVIVTRVEVR